MSSGPALAHDDRGSGRAIVLVHGHPFNRGMWAPQADSLARDFRVVAPDLPGYGASPPRGARITMRELADAVLELVDGLGIARATVVGLSMGGLVAMELALARPDRVDGLVLAATTAAPVTPEEAHQRRGFAADIEENGMLGAAAAALRGRAERPDYSRLLSDLRVPSLVVAGDADPYAPAPVTDQLVASLPAPEVVRLPGVGHLPHLEAPERFDAALRAFVSSVGVKAA
jgi:3-oxoadipate enol-lactonase